MRTENALKRARKDAEQGKSPSTQAGEFVREEIEHIREGKHGARSAKQAIAIGLSKARRAGVQLASPNPATTPKPTVQKARDDSAAARSPRRPRKKRSLAALAALQRESSDSASSAALSEQAHTAASHRTRRERSRVAKKAAASRKHPE